MVQTFEIYFSPKHRRKLIASALSFFAKEMLVAKMMRQRRVGCVVEVAAVRITQMAVEMFLPQVSVQFVRIHESFLAKLA